MNPDPRIAFFDRLAAGWDAERPSAEAMAQNLGRHADLLGLCAGATLLEVGCGTGKTTGYLADRVAPGRVTAIDFAPRMIEQARAKRIDADFHCLDICKDPPGRACFDIVLCLHSFPHFRDQPAALRHCAHAMTPAGRLIVMHLAGSDHINTFHAQMQGAVNHDLLPVGEQWTPLLAQAGLKQVRLIDREDLFFLQAHKSTAPD